MSQYKFVLVFSTKDSPVANLASLGTNSKLSLLMQHEDTMHAPVELGEMYSNRFGTCSNDEEFVSARRNKFNMQ